MEHLRAVFSRQNLPKLLLLVGVYLLGRMEGEGRFQWSDVFDTAWSAVVAGSSHAADSARRAVGM